MVILATTATTNEFRGTQRPASANDIRSRLSKRWREDSQTKMPSGVALRGKLPKGEFNG